VHQKLAQPQIRAENRAQLQPADEHLLRIVTPVLERPQHRIDRVVVELLQLDPVGTPEQYSQIRLVEHAPGKLQAAVSVAVDQMRGDGVNNFVQLSVIFRRRPVPPVDR
jgi:hypothetical protein